MGLLANRRSRRRNWNGLRISSSTPLGVGGLGAMSITPIGVTPVPPDPYLDYAVFDSMLGDAATSIDARMPEKGGPWTVNGLWNTDGAGYADYNTSGADSFAITEGLADCFIHLYGVKYTAADSAATQIVFNYLDDDNYYSFGQYFNLQRLVKKVGGFETNLLLTIGPGWTQGQVYDLKVQRNGNNIKCWINDALSISVDDADLKTETGVGLRGKMNAFDYWKVNLFICSETDVTPPADPPPDAPTNLEYALTVPGDPDEYELTWDNSDAFGWKVFHNGVEETTVGINTVSVFPEIGDEYYVVAYNGAGDSDPSNTVVIGF